MDRNWPAAPGVELDTPEHSALTAAGSMMIACQAVIVRMVRQGLNDAALTDASSDTSRYHPLQFGLQRCEAGNAPVDVVKMRPGDLGDGLARLIRMIGQFQ